MGSSGAWAGRPRKTKANNITDMAGAMGPTGGGALMAKGMATAGRTQGWLKRPQDWKCWALGNMASNGPQSTIQAGRRTQGTRSAGPGNRFAQGAQNTGLRDRPQAHTVTKLCGAPGAGPGAFAIVREPHRAGQKCQWPIHIEPGKERCGLTAAHNNTPPAMAPAGPWAVRRFKKQ